NCYCVNSADILIAYLSFLLKEDGEQSVNVEYANPFWAIHDMEHAQYDSMGCTIYVDEHIELSRLREAFELMLKEDYELTYELVKEVEEAYNNRFNKNESFEEYLYEQEYKNEEQEEYA